MNLGLAYLKHLQKRYCTDAMCNIIYCDPELMLRIREYIESCFERCSSPPTVREVDEAMGIAVSSVRRYLQSDGCRSHRDVAHH